MSPAERLAALGLTLPPVAPPVAAYLPAVRTGGFVYTSGQLPTADGKLPAVGKVGSEVSAADAAGMARTCALNALAAAAAAAGGLDAIRRIVKVTGFVASAPGFNGQPQVVNGASELLIEVFGEDGRHARSAVGVAELPLDAPVEVELIAEIRDLAQPCEQALMTEQRMTRAAVPRKMAQRAREIAAGRLSPAVPRDAATVMLLRQASGVEALLLRRAAVLEFAPGACVFPGGSVDECDTDPEIGWAGPSPADFAEQLGASPEHSRALVCAAIRETFEECGVLLAGPKEPSPTALVHDSAALAQDRHSLLEGSTSFAGVLNRRGLVLRADLLTPWARWITPEASPRRFDTWFFAAALPPGQTAALAALPEQEDRAEQEGTAAQEGRTDSGESDSATWLRPSAALKAARAGEIRLLPPTAATLVELAAHQDMAGILAQRRVIGPLLPKVMLEDERVWLAMPPAPEPQL
jgi:enamine deaminase RidA (YjgF/YER057c/UK114 family)/8-oxo-dGTP pyrophosphatase MutT (NUDIX family)